MVFDEFVDLKDVFNQVVVSPPLAKRPIVTKKKRTVRFDFDEDEVLRPEATYTINFGEAVRDFTEGNAVPDLRFVFSTGNFIDSLEVNGKIVDALTGEPSKDVLMMLYDNLSDTVVRTERPFYFAKTGEDGQFKIGNVKSDTFKIFALFDSNLNYLYDQESELIGFSENNIILNGDSNLILPTIRLFHENPPLKIIEKKAQSGLVKLTFNQQPREIEFEVPEDLEKISHEYELDTIKVWYDWEGTEEWQLFINRDTSFFDTIEVKTVGKETFLKKRKLKPLVNQRKVAKINPTKFFSIELNHPIAIVDTAKINFLEDSVSMPIKPEISFDQRELTFKYRWKEDSLYQVQILPNALTDIYGLMNADTIIRDFKAAMLKDFGNMLMAINGLDSLNHYVIQLYSENNSILVKEFQIKDSKEFKTNLNTLSPGKYEIKIITDLNENGRWDTGDYDKKLQPEPIFTIKTKDLRANWDIEEEITLID